METFNYTTYCRHILADLHTPVGVYMRLRDLYPQSALMESSDYHGNDNARSFIGVHPLASIAIGHGVVTCKYPDGTNQQETLPRTDDGDRCKLAIADAIDRFIHSFHVCGEGQEYCGLYGFTSFNAVRYFENIAVRDTTMEKNDAPDIYYVLFRDVIVFDHFNNTMTLVTLGERPDDTSEMDMLLRAINKASVKAYDFHPVGDTTSTLTDEEHKANIRRCVEHCMRGDVFQIVVSRRFVQRFEGDDFKLYRALRSINPSPYLFSVASVSSDRHPKPITASWAIRLISILLLVRPVVQAIQSRTGRMPSFYVTTQRRMPNMSCWLIWHVMI